jgi:hypothetical protein
VSLRREPIDDVIRDPLPGLRDQLMNEYGEVVSLERIDEAAEHALAELDGARIRDFVPVFAWRHAREHLRKAA